MTKSERQLNDFVNGIAQELDIDLRVDTCRSSIELWYTYGTSCPARACNKIYYHKDIEQAYQIVHAIYASYMIARKEWA